MNKKAFGAVIATSLLIVVSVIAVSTFQSWFQNFESNTLSNVETKSNNNNNNNNNLGVEGIIGDNLYLKSNSDQIISILKILDSNGNSNCELNDNKKSNLSSNTIMAFNFENSSNNGSHFLDLSNYNNNAKLNGAIQCNLNSISGNSCQFDGSNDYLEILDSNSLKLNYDDFTICTWFKLDFFLPSNQQIYSKRKNAFGNYEFQVTPNTLNKTQIYISDTSGMSNTVQSSSIIQGKWYQHCMIRKNNNFNMYIDSILDSNLNMVKNISSISNLNIGRDNQGSNEYFNGQIDSFVMYSNSLNQKELDILYNSKKALFYEQILPKGIKIINISNCNLNKGNVYDVIIFSNLGQKVEKKVIVK